MNGIEKVISLWQPWATPFVLGIKLNETRSWATNYRGRVYIHAAMNKSVDTIQFTNNITYYKPNHYIDFSRKIINLLFGVIIGYVDIVDCVRAETIRDKMTAQELSFGDYSDGRWIWICKNHTALETPIPAKGSQGFWNFNIREVK